MLFSLLNFVVFPSLPWLPGCSWCSLMPDCSDHLLPNSGLLLSCTYFRSYPVFKCSRTFETTYISSPRSYDFAASPSQNKDADTISRGCWEDYMRLWTKWEPPKLGRGGGWRAAAGVHSLLRWLTSTHSTNSFLSKNDYVMGLWSHFGRVKTANIKGLLYVFAGGSGSDINDKQTLLPVESRKVRDVLQRPPTIAHLSSPRQGVLGFSPSSLTCPPSPSSWCRGFSMSAFPWFCKSVPLEIFLKSFCFIRKHFCG